MIHTFELRKQATATEYITFTSHPEVKDKKSVTIAQGIHMMLTPLDKADYKGFIFTMIVNCTKLLQCSDPIETATETDWTALERNFNKSIRSFFPEFPSLREWPVSRIDYCQNCKTENVTRYIQLLKHGDRIIYRSNEKQERNSLRNAFPQRDDSFYLVADKDYTLNIYDKEKERKNKNAPQEEIEKAKNILRVEVQCKKPKLQSLKKKFKLQSRSVKDYFRADIAESVLLESLNRIVPDAAFLRKTTAYALLQPQNRNCTLQENTRKEILQIMKDVNGSRGSIYTARRKTKLSKDKFRNRIKKLTDHGMNIITIPDKANLNGKDHLESIQDLVRKSKRSGERSEPLLP